MNGSHLALGATALLAAVSAVSKRGSAKRYRAKGRIDLHPEYEFEFESDGELQGFILEDARDALMNADWDDVWKETVEQDWRWGSWWDGDWDQRLEVEEAPALSIRDLQTPRPPFLGER